VSIGVECNEYMIITILLVESYDWTLHSMFLSADYCPLLVTEVDSMATEVSQLFNLAALQCIPFAKPSDIEMSVLAACHPTYTHTHSSRGPTNPCCVRSVQPVHKHVGGD